MNRFKVHVWFVAGGLILLQMILVAIMVRGESLTFDEGDHIFAGYMMWHGGDYGLNPEHPPLVKLVATLPLLQEKLWVPPLQQRWFKSEAYRDGRDFMERNDGPEHRLLFRMRLAASVFAVGLLVTVFLMGSELFGEPAGLLALLLMVFEPNVLANSDLVTTDMGVACFLLVTIYCFYRYARQPSVIRLLVAGLAGGLTLSAKHSGILVAPMLLGLALVEIACAERRRRKRMAGTLFGGLAAIVVLAVVVLWAFYGFRYAARPAGLVARCYRSGDLTAVWVPDEGSEALRDLVRAREAAKQDQTRARHRLSKFLLRSGQRPPTGVRSWTRPYLIWVAQLRFTQIAQESTRQDYLHEVEHMRERVARLEQAITEAIKLASPALQQVINDLQALRGIADISAVTIAAELGQVSRFQSARQLMGYCGVVPSEDSSGKRTRRGGITKTGNAHLRRIVVEAAWSYRRPPGIWYGLRRRQESISEEAKEIAWKAQHRLHKRYIKLGAAGKDQRKIVTAVARELLGFIWAIGTRAETISRQQVAA